MFDSHVHSLFSPDSEAPMIRILDKSIQKGLKSLCFTDHFDLDFDGKGHDLTFDIKEYFSAIHKLQKEYKGQIDICAGIELGLQPHVLNRYEGLLQGEPFDYILASIHSVDRQDLFSGSFFDSRNQTMAYFDYFSSLKECIIRYDNFQALGHVDVIKRYGNYPESLPFSSYREILQEIFRLLIDKGKGLELNTSGIRYGLEAFHPSIEILRDYKDLGGEIITLGSDSHTANGTGSHFPEALALLHQLGFKYYTSFKKQQPIFHKIEDSL